MIETAVGGRAQGLLLHDVTEQDRARLDHYEGAFGYHLRSCDVETATGPQAAQVYFPEPGLWPRGAPWSLEDWVRDWGLLTQEAASEVMAHFSRPEAEGLSDRFGMVRARAQSHLRAQQWDRVCDIGSALTADDVDIGHKTRPYLGFFTLEEYRVRHRLYDGRMSDPVERAVFRAADAVTVLPYDPVRDRVLLIEQLRLGAYAHGDPQPWLLETVAGIVDAGEDYEDTARRETREEAGVEIGALHHLGRYYPTSGAVAQVLVSYLGIADIADDLPVLGGLDAEGEDIRVVAVDAEAALRMLDTGEASTGPLIISLLWLARNRERLKQAALTA